MAYLQVGNLTEVFATLEKLYRVSSRYPDFPKNGTLIPQLLVNPNYVVPRRFNPIIPLTITTTIIYSLVIIVRLYTRGYLESHRWGTDDALIIPGWLAGIGVAATNVLLVTKGSLGTNTYDTSYPALSMGLYLEQINFFLYVIAQTSLRCSVLTFFLRLAGSAAKALRRLTIATLCFQIAFLFYCIYVVWFSCTPLAAGWDLDVRVEENAECHRRYPGILSAAIIFTATDYWEVCLPIPTVLKLKMPLMSKLGVTLLFSFGFVASICGTVRTLGVPGTFNSFNATWNAVELLVWDQLELTFGFIAASMPALNVLLVRAFARPFTQPTIPSGSLPSPQPQPRFWRAPIMAFSSFFTSAQGSSATQKEQLTTHDAHGMTFFLEKTMNDHTSTQHEGGEEDNSIKPPFADVKSSEDRRRTRRWNSTFGYVDCDEDSAAPDSLDVKRPWDLEVGEPRRNHLPDIAALTNGNIKVVRSSTNRPFV